VAKIKLVRVRKQIRAKPPSSSNPLTISADEIDWAHALCTHGTYLFAGIKKRIDDKLFRPAYVAIRPSMEAALKCLWVLRRVKRKSIPETLGQLVYHVEAAFPQLQNLFSIQMERKDRFGNDCYRKVNGWIHADPEMWDLYKGGEEIQLVLNPLGNMVSQAQCELSNYIPGLVDANGYWVGEFQTGRLATANFGPRW